MFVQRRVEQIRSLVGLDCWFYVRSKLNPADLLSRGLLFSQLVKNDLWFNGPSAILSSDVPFLKYKVDNLPLTENTVLLVTQEEEAISENVINLDIMNISSYNSYNKLLRVTAFVLRFISNLKRKTKKDKLNLSTYIYAEERIKAERLWILFLQFDIYHNKQYQQLKKDLGFVIIDNIIRCKGRLGNSKLSYDRKFPIFLPKGHFTELLVSYYHNKVLHNGVKDTLNEIRTRFWIPKARNFIRKVIKQCLLCTKFEAPAYVYPVSSSLPISRLSTTPPFTFTSGLCWSIICTECL